MGRGTPGATGATPLDTTSGGGSTLTSTDTLRCTCCLVKPSKRHPEGRDPPGLSTTAAHLPEEANRPRKAGCGTGFSCETRSSGSSSSSTHIKVELSHSADSCSSTRWKERPSQAVRAAWPAHRPLGWVRFSRPPLSSTTCSRASKEAESTSRMHSKPVVWGRPTSVISLTRGG